jgi:hypothetical protein
MPGFSSSSALAVVHTNWFETINQPYIITHKNGPDSYPYKAEGHKILQVLCQIETSQNVNCTPAIVIMGGTVW